VGWCGGELFVGWVGGVLVVFVVGGFVGVVECGGLGCRVWWVVWFCCFCSDPGNRPTEALGQGAPRTAHPSYPPTPPAPEWFY